MTPKIFTEEVAYVLAGLDNVDVIVRDKEWAQQQGMNAFLSVARGSQEPLRFLEIHYKGGKEGEKPLGLVGKGKPHVSFSIVTHLPSTRDTVSLYFKLTL